MTSADGTELIASGDHRLLTGRGWKHVTGSMAGRARRPHLTTNDELMGFGRTHGVADPDLDHRRGYLTGMVRGDTNLKVYRYSRLGRAHGDVHRFRLALTDDEGLVRTSNYLLEAGVLTTWFRFSPATEHHRQLNAIRTSAAASVARIDELVAWPPATSTAWRRDFLAGIFDAEGSRSAHILRICNCGRGHSATDDRRIHGPALRRGAGRPGNARTA